MRPKLQRSVNGPLWHFSIISGVRKHGVPTNVYLLLADYYDAFIIFRFVDFDRLMISLLMWPELCLNI